MTREDIKKNALFYILMYILSPERNSRCFWHVTCQWALIVWRTDKQSDTSQRRKMTRNDDEACLCVLSKKNREGEIRFRGRREWMCWWMCVCVIVRLAFRMWCHTGWPTSARQKEQNIWLWRANGRSPRLGGGWTNPIKERDEMYRQTVLYNWALSAIWLSFYMSHCKMVLIKSWEYNLNIGTDQIVWWIPSGHRLCDLKRKEKHMQICNTGSHADWLACTCGLYTVRNNGTIKIHLCP